MLRIASLLTAALLVAAPQARAQSALDAPAPSALPAASTADVPASPADPSGPALDELSAGARPAMAADLAHDALSDEATMLRRRARFSRAETYMIVGGATFLAGALIGKDAGTIVMVGGAAVGLYGLYLYLQQ